jgi:uncharacterized membrane protein (UPF0127 family)
MAVRLVIVAVVIALGIISSALVLYFNPAISSTLGQPEDKEQVPPLDEEVRSATNGYRQVNVEVNGLVLIADIAATDEQKVKGLSVKDNLEENEAMLFVFDNEAQHLFWMKNMKFPIDIIWIDSDKRVVHIEHNLQPCSSELLCPGYKPVSDSLYVLETVAGFAERHGITKGTPVDFELNT